MSLKVFGELKLHPSQNTITTDAHCGGTVEQRGGSELEGDGSPLQMMR